MNRLVRSWIKHQFICILQLSAHAKRGDNFLSSWLQTNFCKDGLPCLWSFLIMFGNGNQPCSNDFLWFLLNYFLESETQELGRIRVSVITYYGNWQQLLPYYMPLLAWTFNVCNFVIKRYWSKPTIFERVYSNR